MGVKKHKNDKLFNVIFLCFLTPIGKDTKDRLFGITELPLKKGGFDYSLCDKDGHYLCTIKITHAKGKKREVAASSVRKTEKEFNLETAVTRGTKRNLLTVWLNEKNQTTEKVGLIFFVTPSSTTCCVLCHV